MKVVIFTDTHFGCRGGSRTWFNSQSDFIYKQFIPFLKDLSSKENVILLHLGDVFDSRSTLNTMIATEVKKMFTELASIVKDFYIIPGNHDYFSEQTDTYCTVSLVLNNIKNLHIVEHTFLTEFDGVPVSLIPWHAQKETSITEYTKNNPNRIVFTHSDIIMGNPKIYSKVFSGHIHTPYINDLYCNLGSCFPLDFHDHNQLRYFYIWDPQNDKLIRHANERSLRFWRWKDDEIMSINEDKLTKDDYIELYISSSLMSMQDYQEKIEYLKTKYRNLWVIPVPEELVNNSVDIACDIESILEQSIPEDLMEKFNIIKAQIYGGTTK